MRFSSRRWSSGCAAASSVWLAARAAFCSMRSSMVAYGRAANTRSCARRSLAAETIFMALVICCVFLTERMRRRISIRLGMRCFRVLLRHKALFEFGYGGRDVGAQRVIQSLFDADLFPHGWMRVVHEAVEFLFELAAL